MSFHSLKMVHPAVSSETLSGGHDNGNSAGPCSEPDEDLQYKPVQPRKTITVSVRYRVRGRALPLPYLLDEGEE